MIFDLDGSLGFLLNRTNTKMKNFLLHKFKEYDVTPEQWAILNRLWVRDGVSPKELAELTSKDQPNTVRILTKIENKGFITRRINSEDNRSFLIYLTPIGRELKYSLIPLAYDVLNKATYNIDGNKIEIVKEVLNKIFKNLEAEE